MNQLLLVAGEASADLHASALLRELRQLEPDLSCFGVGGKELRESGMEVIVPAEDLNVVGISDWLGRWREVLGSYRKVCEAAARRKPDCAVLLDLPDFNLRLAHRLKDMGIPVVYYISPQVWAWRGYRVKKIKKYVERMLVVFPFEREFYRQRDVEVEFVGHPLLERIEPRQSFRSQAEVQGEPRFAVLPGSRPSELRHHAALLNETVSRLARRFPGASFRLPVASTLSLQDVRQALPDPTIELVEGAAADVLRWADCALVASGTATLETALIGTPFCLFYIVSPSSGWVIENLLRYKGFYGMPNLLHKRAVVQEFVQKNARAELLFHEMERLVLDPIYRQQMGDALRASRALLGETGASQRAAKQVQTVLQRHRGGNC
jgi:lipid-A-disaccharide synthase